MDKIIGKQIPSQNQDNEHWVSMSDLMAGLMMVFMFISIAYMHYVRIEKEKIKEVAVAYEQAQQQLYNALNIEFSNDLPDWDAEIDKQTLEVRFKSPDVLFGLGSSELKPKFKEILNNFFPRYLKVLDQYKEHITEVRIEGHTSTDWTGAANQDEAYFNNMELSQGRTRAVLQYVHSLKESSAHQKWVKSKFSAVGYSSSHPILNAMGKEDQNRSRRVTFKVITNAELQIRRIIQE
ncbi:TPA: OmpA family protein [Serratia marcescens]|jgi:outer membrane protein OmpA-like peptidoglycan-associated protein|uniref:type II Zorya anti-phage system protein ZorB2 n=1 Tax=Serratia TaxID=613 RepID=UPI000760745F|nr:type II Zorya anti-phage system protein ZorB2 [Serratia marcescens]MDF8319335.1 OmpA family protein [Serratia nevei]EGT0502506.1 OmpA family protein [Serratia marcescens]EHT9827580.1 OmpA family protein [Serratia marcescens]EIU0969036.1 OmpA family protein [Serratia marcescens]EMB7752069.1 OmpA family protein [Serratia marcescens]